MGDHVEPKDRIPQARSLTRFRGIAERTLDRLRDIFTPQSPVLSQHYLVGRDTLARKLSNILRTPGATVILYGAKRVGKTSLAKTIARQVSDRVGYHTCSHRDTLEKIVTSLLGDLPRLRQRTIREGGRREGGVSFQILRGSAGSSREVEEIEDINVTPHDSLAMIAKRAADEYRVVILDDIAWMQAEERAEFADLVKVWSDTQSQSGLVLIIEAEISRYLDLVSSIIPEYIQIRGRVAEVKVEPLTRNDIALLISRGFSALELPIEELARTYILKASQEVPGEAHFYCRGSVHAWVERNYDRLREGKNADLTVRIDDARAAERERPSVD